jgi:hypothetical protein
MFYNARWYDPYLNHFTQPDSIVPDPYNPQDWNRYSYARNNPLKYTDPSGHRPCDEEYSCDGDNGNTNKVNARIYYLNAIGLGNHGVIQPNSDPKDEQGYLLYRLGLAAGSENVIHIPIYKGSVWDTRWEMLGEALLERRTWSPVVANTIIGDLQDRPLSPGERLILVGNSGGGTIAIESLDLLEDAGIYVDQVILRGSPVQEDSLKNVGSVDYITSHFDHYYSYDSNPNDGVDVQEHQVDFWGHEIPDSSTVVKIANLMISLIIP